MKISFQRLREEFFPARHPLDKQLGVDTSGKVSLRRLVIHSANKAAGVHYGPVDPERFAHAMRYVPKDLAFVDLGCGKGRALILAHQAGFRELIGVEFSAALAVSARTNLKHLNIDAEILEQDAATYLLPDRPCVVFMYNPFRPPVFNEVAANLVQHGRVFVVYVNPWHRDVLQSTGAFEPLLEEPTLFVARTRF